MEYKTICAEGDIFDLIFDLRRNRASVFGAVVDRGNFGKYIETCQHICDRIDRIEDAADEGLVDLSSLSISTGSIRILTNDYPEMKVSFERMLERVSVMGGCCANLLPLSIELIEFFRDCGDLLSEDYKRKLSEKICELLKKTKYDRSSSVSKYIMGCPYVNFYDAYFFGNESLPKEEHTYLLNEYIGRVAKGDSSFESRIRQHIEAGAKYLDEDSLKTLLECGSWAAKERARNVLTIIQEKGIELPFEIRDYVTSRLAEIEKSEMQFAEVANLFEGCLRIAPVHEWLSSFVDGLVILENGDVLAKGLASYLDSYYPGQEGQDLDKNPFAGVSQLFKDVYFFTKSYNSHRSKTLVMKSIEESIDE